MLHAALIVAFALLSWRVSQRPADQTFTVGIMVKKDTPEGEVFENQDTTFSRREDPTRADMKFLPDAEATAAAAAKLPDVDLSAIGVAGSPLASTGELVAVPDGGTVAGAMASTKFFDAQVWGSRFVYVIDRSGSMAHRDRINVAKRELLSSLALLAPEAQFQIIFYNTQPTLILQPKNRRLHYASDQNKTLAAREIGTMIPDGATDHLIALKSAIGLKPDVIFFLTDAEDLRITEVKEVTELNKDRARIHTIAFGVGPEVEGQDMLRELADRNGGSYRYIDADRYGRRAREAGP
jgi:hypothetical protein